MTLNRANRAFFLLLAIAFVAYQLLGAGACVLFGSLISGLIAGNLALDASVWGVTALGLFLVVYVLGWVLAIFSLIRQSAATMRLRERVRSLRLPTPPALRDAARRARIEGRVDLVDSAEAFSFAYGVFDTRVAVSRGLVETVAPPELDAVLVHERYHLRSRDPLKVFIARLVAKALFFLPVLAELRHRYVVGRELAADRRALRAYGERPLAGALYKVVAGPLWSELGAAAAIGGRDHLEARVAQLESGEEPPGEPIPTRAWITSAAGSVALLVSFFASVIAFGGPVAMMRSGAMMDTRHEMSGIGWFWSAAIWLVVLGAVIYVGRRSRRPRRRLTTTVP